MNNVWGTQHSAKNGSAEERRTDVLHYLIIGIGSPFSPQLRPVLENLLYCFRRSFFACHVQGF